MNTKDVNSFESIMKRTDRLNETVYKATTDKRRTIIIPEGVVVFDTDEKKNYIGDGVTRGGLSGSAKLSVRKIVINAAASAGLSANPTTDKITWTTYGSLLRTGDAIILAAGNGTIPTGASATTYYIVKEENDPASASFKIASSRANALAGTTVNLTTSGVPGWTSVINQVAVQGSSDVLFIDPVGAAATVYLPYPTAGVSPQVTVKRAAAGNFTITIAALNADGAAATLSCDDASSNISMASGSIAKGYTLWGDPASHEYFTIAKITA
jgi:hypothetical protein